MKTQWIAFAIFVCVLTYQETDGRKHDTKRHQRKFAKATKFSDLAKLNEDLEASRLKDKRAENETDGEKEETKQSLSIDEVKDHHSKNKTSKHHNQGRLHPKHHGKKHHKGSHKKRHGRKHAHHHKRQQPHMKHHRWHHNGDGGKDVRENVGLDQTDLPKHAWKGLFKRLMKLAKRERKHQKEIQTRNYSSSESVE